MASLSCRPHTSGRAYSLKFSGDFWSCFSYQAKDGRDRPERAKFNGSANLESCPKAADARRRQSLLAELCIAVARPAPHLKSVISR